MSRLNYHHLYYFWRVAHTGHLTDVAEQLHISQSALSTQIKQLEHSCGFSLFERQGRKLRLTEQGRRVLLYANDIFNRGEALEELIKRGVKPKQQTLRLGLVSTMSRNFIDDFVAPLITQEDVTFSLESGNHDYLLERLANYHLDLLLTNNIINLKRGTLDWQSHLLSRQEVIIVGPNTEDAKELASSAFPKAYSQWRWVLPGPKTQIRQAFNAFCAMHDFEPNILAESDDMAMLRLLARDTGALAVLPRIVVVDEMTHGDLRAFITVPNSYEYFYGITVAGRVDAEILNFLYQRDQYQGLNLLDDGSN